MPPPEERPLPTSVDVVVVGAGTAGAAAALLCARRGLSVLCLDRAPLDRAGARWVNGVPARAFDEAGLARPRAPELRGGDEPFHLVAGWGPERVVIERHGVVDVDMRHLVARLQGEARDAGATLEGETAVSGMSEGALHTSRGTVHARFIVDASGLAGARLLGQPRIDPRDLCVAAQEVRRVEDRAAASDFLARHGAGEGHTLCFTGVAGGYSIVNVRVHGDEVGILTGSIPAEGHAPGRTLLERFVAEQPWIGAALFGGSRAIPLRRPWDALARGRVALLGDAACQVFPAHGSGIGPGLVAARVLADSLAAGRGVEGYAIDWQRRHGGLLASYDLFRRFSQGLGEGEVGRMVRAGLLDPELGRAGLSQHFPSPDLWTLPARASALARTGRLGARLSLVVGRMLAVRALYASYPASKGARARWARWVRRAAGE